MLPGRADKVGEAGLSSAGRFTPAVVAMGGTGAAAAAAAAAAAVVLPFDLTASFGVSGGVGTASSRIGEGRGGGMSVPSVSAPNFRSRAGSSKRLVAVPFAGFAAAAVSFFDGMSGFSSETGLAQSRLNMLKVNEWASCLPNGSVGIVRAPVVMARAVELDWSATGRLALLDIGMSEELMVCDGYRSSGNRTEKRRRPERACLVLTGGLGER